MLNALKSRLDRHFVACSAVAAAATVGGVAQQNAEAAIVYSGVVNLPIAATTNGLYLNVVNGAINEPGNTAGTSVPGWDINPWGSTSLNFFNPTAPAGGVYATVGGLVARFAGGEAIGPASTWGTTNTNWNPAGPTITGYIGFRFQNEANGNQIHYGWAQIINDGLSTRKLVAYAYDNVAGTAINAGAIPTPGSLALLALGAAGLVGRRRK